MCQSLIKFNRIMSLSLKKLQKRVPKSPESNGKSAKMSRRFDGLSEQEIMDKKSTLDDILEYNLDLVFVGINPSLMGAFTGRYYAGPGNHFYKLLYESELIPEPINHENDKGLLKYKIGLTNIVARATRSSADLTRTELKIGAATVHEKLKKFKPKIAVFNGKCIFEEFIDKYDKSSFRFGLQPSCVGETALWVVPSSSARCANFPRMQDKLHFYTSLKIYLSYLKGEIDNVNLEEFRFDGKSKQIVSSTSKMWRRKSVSAFANGGKIVNKETFVMNTSDESLYVPQTNEFIIKKKDINDSEIDSGVSASQSSVESYELLMSQNSDNVIVKQESSLSCKIDDQQSSHENLKDEKQIDSKLRKQQNSSKEKGKNRVANRCTRVAKERSKTIDFMSLIKQKLNDKKEMTNDDDARDENDDEDCKNDQTFSQSSVKRLNYQNLCSGKSKRGFKIKEPT